jgi:hypothetical protein
MGRLGPLPVLLRIGCRGRRVVSGAPGRLFIFLLSLALIAVVAPAGRIPRSDTVSSTDPLLMQQGGGSGTANGDYISCSALDGPYRYYIEVPAGASRLVVDIFDADLGAGGTTEAAAGRDRQRGGYWNTSTAYRLYDPSGTQVTTDFTTGDAANPPGADNAWLTLYDSLAPPQFVGYRTATRGPASSLTINVPPGDPGDFLIAIVSKHGTGAIDQTPSGWTLLSEGGSGTGGSAIRLGVFYRWAATETQVTVSWTTGNDSSVGGVLRYSGVDSTTPIDVSGAATGTSNAPTAPAVVTTVPEARVVRIMGANDNTLSGSPYPSGHTGRFAVEQTFGSDMSGAAADTTQTSAGSTGTAAFSLDSNEAWRAITVALRPVAGVAPQSGHWLLEVDTSDSAGDDIQSYGVRAHDGDPGPGGTEIPVYAQPFLTYGVTDTPFGASDTYAIYPYVTGKCSIRSSDFDMDAQNSGDQGELVLDTRGGRQILSVPDAQLSSNDVWADHVSGAIDANSIQNINHGIFTGSYRISNFQVSGVNNANYTVVYFTDPDGAAPPPASLTVPSYRIYFPSDAGSAPVKPYLEQELTYVSGPQAPTEGQTTIVQVTVRMVNPTASSITFSTPSNLVSVTIPNLSPDASVVLDGGLDATAGTTIVSYPAVGSPGAITWNPGTLASNDTVILTYRVRVRPSNGVTDSQVVYVTGSGTSNGTQAVYLDETGAASQTRATYTFGPLCGLSVTEGSSITYVSLSSFRAYTDKGQTRVEWQTSGEAGTAGFVLQRLNAASGVYEPVRPDLVRAFLTAPQGGTYSIIDPKAVSGGIYTYCLVEVQANGGRRVYGPFDTVVDGNWTDLLLAAGRKAPSTDARLLSPDRGDDGGVAREARRVSGRTQARTRLAWDQRESLLAEKHSLTGQARAKLAVTETGLYQLTAARIAEVLGKSPDFVRDWISQGNILITNRNSRVQYVSADGGESLCFLGEAIDSPYTTENIYWIEEGPAGGLVAVQEGAGPSEAQPGQLFTENLKIEQDVFGATVVPVNPAIGPWYWEVLYGGSRASFQVLSPGVAPTGEATLRVRVQGCMSGPTLNDHEATVLVNGTQIGAGSWDDLATRTLVFKFSSTLLTEANTVEVISSPTSAYYLDGFDLSYPRYLVAKGDSLLFTAGVNQVVTVDGFSSDRVVAIDVTNPSAATLITATMVEPSGNGWRVSFSPTTPGGRYLAVGANAVKSPAWFAADAPSSLADAENEADYLVIAPEELKTSAEALAAYRGDRTGLRTRIAWLEDIYDEFNGGIADPNAIRSFLQHAYLCWRRAPRYVVLLGKGTLDYKDAAQRGTSLLPPMLVATADGLFASDNRFADVVGNDGVPEYALGRIPVVSDEEFAAYLAKLSASERSERGGRSRRETSRAGAPTPGRGRGASGENVLLTAEARDGAADFKTQAQAMASLALTARQAVYGIYLDDLPLADARAYLQTALNVQGMAVLAHVGHGGMDRLASQGLLLIPDVQNLTNADRLPFVAALSCMINRFEVPEIDPVLGEELIISPKGGASAVWAPTGTSLDSYAGILGKKLFEAIYLKGAGRVGDAVVDAMASFREEVGGRQNILDVYTLLGDPAAHIAGRPSAFRKGASHSSQSPGSPQAGE